MCQYITLCFIVSERSPLLDRSYRRHIYFPVNTRDLEAHKLGYQHILWMDASIIVKQPIEQLFELIEKDGYLIFHEDHSLGQFCKDDALEPLGITREESFTMPCCWSCVVGLNLADRRSMEFLRQWKEKSCDEIASSGPKWSGVRGWPRTASQDPRVSGHRTQTVASVIALKLGMNRWKTKEQFREFFERRQGLRKEITGTIIHCRNQNDVAQSR